MKKETIDFLNAIKTGHTGSIAGNPAHANLKKGFVFNAHADVRQIKELYDGDKFPDAVIQNCTAKIVLGEAGNDMNKETKVYVCNAHADISDYKELALSDKEIEALLQNCTTKIVLGETGGGKKTDMRTGLGAVLPSRILDMEPDTE